MNGEPGNKYIEGAGWWGQDAESEESTLVHGVASDANEVLIEASSLADYRSEEDREARAVKVHMPALDALAFAKQIEAAAYESLVGIGDDE